MFQLPEKIKNQGTAVALGYFDGIHLGHKAVLDTALEWAEKENLVPVVMLFDIHPRKLISGDVPPMLLREEKKNEILTKMGFTVVPFNFREAMDYSPNEFIDRILIDGLNARVVSCGFDYHYGKGGRGDAKSLGDELERRGVKLFAEEAVLVDGEVVSSTTIRALIAKGEIEKANTMLGFCFSYDFIVPRYGVYASKVLLDNKWYPAVTNVGVRPTVANSSMRSETCIFDFSGDLYGKNVEVSLLRFIRDEIKFSDIDALSQQIERDIVTARNIYDEVSKNG